MRISSEGRFSIPFLSYETEPTLVNKTGLWRFLTPARYERVSPCRAACPLENGIPHWIQSLKKGDWEEAWHIITQYNPFPAVTGHVCYRYCQVECNRGFYDEEIAIAELEKNLGLWGQENYSKLVNPVKNNKRNKGTKIAVVGSGPAGLSCACYLNALGAEVTVFEKLSEAGGLLAAGIPEYRLPREVLHKEIEILQHQGIDIKTNTEIGKDISIEGLKNNFNAILLAVGAQQSRDMGVEGSHLPGVIGALDFLQEVNLQRNKQISGSVIVVGGGNAALDSASLAKFNGAGEVTLLYHRSREDMPAHEEEVKTAQEMGVKLLFHVKVDEVLGQEKAEKVKALQTTTAARGKPVEVIPDSHFYLDCDLLIAATGQESNLPEMIPSISSHMITENNSDINESGNHVFLFLKDFYTEKNDLVNTLPFAAAGDAVSGPSNVAKAILAGRKAALELSSSLWPDEELKKSSFIAPSLENGGKGEKVPFEELNPFVYIKKSKSDSVKEEVQRCFSCGTCNNCGVCWAFCPDLAVEGESGEYEILLDYCKGCGICVAECPAGALKMVVSSNGTQIDER